MAAAKPIVSTDVGGVRDILGNAGLVVPSKDPHALAEAINYFIKNSEERIRHGMIGRDRAKDFRIKRLVEDIENLYLNLYGII